MNPEEKNLMQPDSATAAERQARRHRLASETAFQFKQIRVIQPLRLSDEDHGSDPYNRTGRFTMDG